MDTFTFAELFAGIGGFGVALEKLGGTCTYANEFNIEARRTYKANFDVLPDPRDLWQVDPREIPDCTVLCGGFPCQPHSKNGRRLGMDDPRGQLIYKVLDIVEAKRPQIIILENVQETLKPPVSDIIFDALSELKYEVHQDKLDLQDFGIPQRRVRAFHVAITADAMQRDFVWPTPSGKCRLLSDILEPNALIDPKYLLHKPDYIFRAVTEGEWHPQIIDPDNCPPETVVKTLVCEYSQPQRTGTYVLVGPDQLRKLTTRECQILQGFPQRFGFPVARTNIYRQLGNAAPPPLVYVVTRAAFRTIRGTEGAHHGFGI